MNAVLIFTILYGIIPFVYYSLTKDRNLLKSIYPFLIIVFIASIYEFIYPILFKTSIKYWFLVYKSLAFISLHYFYFFELDKKHKLLFVFFIIVFLVFVILTFSVWNNIFYMEVSSYFNALQTIIVLTFSTLWFVKSFKELEMKSLLESPVFFIIAGLIISYCGTVFLFLLAELLYKIDKSSFQEYWMLNIILNLLLRTLLIFGIWKAQAR